MDKINNERPVPIKLRIMGITGELDKFTDELVEALEATADVQLIERSKPQPCRPPLEGQSRVYLMFVKQGRL